mgnify:FL=1
MEIKYVDAHCHMQFEEYSHDQKEMLEKMRGNGVAGIVVGVDYESSIKAVELAEKHEHIFASIGLHPNCVNKEDFDLNKYRELAKHPKVVAIGECGLDYFRHGEVNEEIKRAQSEVLRAHLALADELDKPLIIHARPSKGTMDAYHELSNILQKTRMDSPKLRGDVHFFVGGILEAKELINLGFTVSFTAVITFARDYDEVIKAVPLANILSETDSPYVAPVSRHGKRNDPLAVVDVVAKIAEIRGEPAETIRSSLLANANRMFTLP